MSVVLEISNPVYSSADNSQIDCVVKLDTLTQPIPFTASINDVEEHGRKIYAEINSGKYGEIGAFIQPATRREIIERAPAAQRPPNELG
ncbi:MAG: hypothetical protein WCH96_08925 [Betaproteobacteria bacterium]